MFLVLLTRGRHANIMFADEHGAQELRKDIQLLGYQ